MSLEYVKEHLIESMDAFMRHPKSSVSPEAFEHLHAAVLKLVHEIEAEQSRKLRANLPTNFAY